MILNKEEIEKAAKKYADLKYAPASGIYGMSVEKYYGVQHGFKAGAEFAEEKIQDLAMEFAVWIAVNNFMQYKDKFWLTDLAYYSGCVYTTEELFKEAAKELMGTQVGMWDFGMKLVEFTQRWISVEEQLPEENVFVLCINPFSPFVASYHGKEKGFRIPNIEGEYVVTHWRPIEYPIL